MAAASERLTALLQAAAPPDAELLARFIRARDQAAFAAIVERHGNWVLGVCCRIAGDIDADDVFQAVFLTLSRNAHRLHRPEALPAWLHATAHRLSLNAVRARRRRSSAENRAAVKSARNPFDELSARELLAILDSCIQKLPEPDRSALILCCLDGLSLDEAAGRLGVSVGTVKGRLERGRARLRKLLEKRGLSVPAVVGAGMLMTQPRAISRPLVEMTIAVSLGESAPSAFVKSLLVSPARRLLPALLFLGTLTVSFGLLTFAKIDTPAQPPAAKIPAPPRVDLLGDPLPDGAVARLGTERLRAPDSSLGLSADGKTIVAVSTNLVVREFDAADGRLKSIRRLANYSSWPTALSPDGKLFLVQPYSGEDSSKVVVWDVAAGRRIFSHALERPAGIHAATYTMDGNGVVLLVLDSRGSAICRANFQTGDWKELVRLPFKYPEHLVASPDGREAVVYDTRTQTLTCWDLTAGEELWRAPNAETYVAFRPDSKAVAINAPGGKNCEFRDAATGRKLSVVQLPPNTRGASFEFQLANFALKYSRSGKELLLFDWEKKAIVIWDIAQGKERVRLPAGYAPNRRIAFTSDDRSLITLGDTLQRWDLSTGKPMYDNTGPLGHTKSVDRIVYSSNGKRLLSVSVDGTARVWDAASGKLLRTWRGHGPVQLSGAAFLPGGRSAVTAGNDGYIRLWDVEAGSELRATKYYDRKTDRAGPYAPYLVLAPGGRIVTTLSYAGAGYRMTRWDVTTGDKLQSKLVDAMIPAPDGKTAILDAERIGQNLQLVDIDSGKPVAQLKHDGDFIVRDLSAFSPDSRMVAGLVRRFRHQPNWSEVKIWESTGGLPLLSIPVSSTDTGRFTFTRDGRLLAFHEAGMLRVWDLATKRGIWRKADPVRTVTSLVFAPDGRTLAAGYDDTTILIWKLPQLKKNKPIATNERGVIWRALASSDSAAANAAVWRLVDDPRSAMPMIHDWCFPVHADSKIVVPLIRDLGSTDFKTREAANKRLKELNRAAEPELRKALKLQQTAEVKRRLAELLQQIDAQVINVRIVAVLEHIATPEAQKLLAKIASGDGRLAREANSALERK